MAGYVHRMREQLRGRARVLRQVRSFFDTRDYVEIEPPILVPAPGLEPNIAAVQAQVCGKRAYLHTSPEFAMKKLVAQGCERIYAMGRVFRDGEVSERHEPEFTMLEWYRVGADAASLMAETAELVSSVLGPLSFERVSFADRFAELGIDFEQIAVGDTQAFAAAATRTGVRCADDDAFDDVFHRVCIEKIDDTLPRACFVTDYPVEQAVLAKKSSARPRFADRFEMFVDGLELCNGFAELTDPVEQRRRFIADQGERARRKLPVYPLDEAFLQAMATMPECAGNALGIDRLVMLALGEKDIAQVNAFSFRGLFG